MCNYELPSEAHVIVDSRQPNVSSSHISDM
jgi:hypothetical protein